MHTFAYCCESFREATRRAAGIEPVTCPPVSVDTFDIRWMEGPGLLYFDLHGKPGDDRWYGDDGLVAMTANQLEQVHLHGSIVFAVNCYLADDNSPMMDALLDAGVWYVVGGDGKNYGANHSPKWAGLLGQWFRRFLALGLPPLVALAWAKRRVKLSAVKVKMLPAKRRRRLFETSNLEAVRDTLAFRVYYRR